MDKLDQFAGLVLQSLLLQQREDRDLARGFFETHSGHARRLAALSYTYAKEMVAISEQFPRKGV